MVMCLQAVDFNIFEGLLCHGAPVVVITQGRVVLENGQVGVAPWSRDYHMTGCFLQLNVVRGCGRFIPRQPFSDIVYSRIQQRDKVLFLNVT